MSSAPRPETAAPERRVVVRSVGLTLGYGRRRVLESVDLEVREGQVWFLLGPNGSGKTTLVHALLGLLEPVAGRIERDAERASRAQLGFVPQRCELNPSLPTTVSEFVGLGFVGSGVRRAERAERMRWALSHAGLAHREHADYWALSGGQRQRALVARALVRRPSLLFLDEPTEGLDIASEEALGSVLMELNQVHQVTLMVVTHKLELARRHATHVALFSEGRVEAGPRDRVLQGDRVERIFRAAWTRPDGS